MEKQTFQRKIEIWYWTTRVGVLPWMGGETFEYESSKKYKRGLSKVISRIEDAGCNAMLLHNRSIFTTIIFIDNGNFRQQ